MLLSVLGLFVDCYRGHLFSMARAEAGLPYVCHQSCRAIGLSCIENMREVFDSEM